jgi:hypothetical protein
MTFSTRALVVALASTSLTLVAPATGSIVVPRHRFCPKAFSLAMFDRAADRVYGSTRTPPVGSYGALWRFARCQRPPGSETWARRLWGRERSSWKVRRHPPMSTAVASWYQDAGATASGAHYFYGFASLILNFGTRVEFCYPAGSTHCVVGTMDDHGPYVGGRTFDLNQNLASALGFGGVDVVAWRVVG